MYGVEYPFSQLLTVNRGGQMKKRDEKVSSVVSEHWQLHHDAKYELLCPNVPHLQAMRVAGFAVNR